MRIKTGENQLYLEAMEGRQVAEDGSCLEAMEGQPVAEEGKEAME